MSEWAPKRFWKAATVEEAGEGFEVRLDGRGVRTPAKAPLHLPTRGMAEAIAAEWDAQEDKVNPLTMPVTRSANAAIDKVRPQRDEVIAMLADYGDSDLLCYRAEAPAELVARQAAAWDPLLDWAAAAYDARLLPRAGIMHAPQDPRALARLREPLEGMSEFQLAAFHDLVSLSGSLVIGLAATRRYQPPETLWDVSRLDEIWQEERWGQDDEATRMALRKKDAFVHANEFYSLS